MSKVEWLCSRCADKEEKETEPDPVVLRLCTSCKVETYVRPFAHFGEDVEPTPEEKEAALAFHVQKMKVLKQATENRKAKDEEDYKEAEKQVLEAETVLESEEGDVVVDGEFIEKTTLDDVSEPEPEPSVPYEPLELTDEEKEIAALKAKIAELEK